MLWTLIAILLILWLLGFTVVELEEHARTLFAEKAERVVRANCNALRVGRYAAKLYAAARSAGQTSLQALHELSGLAPAELMARVEDDLAQAPAQPRCIA